MLEFRLFGGFALGSGDQPVPLTSARARALLAYLVLHTGRPQRRGQLAALLWPDSTDAQARTNLRHVLHVVRGAVLGVDEDLHSGADTLFWNGSWADVVAFEAALQAADDDRDATVDRLTEVVGLYTGDLLDGWTDDWVEPIRESYRRRAVAAIDRLVDLLEAVGDPDAAIAHGRRGLELDPLGEARYRSLIRLHDARGDRAAAVRVFHEGAARLRDELGVEADPQAVAAYEALLVSDHGAGRGPQEVWNGAVNRRPALIARCAGRDDVRLAVRYAREHDLPLTVRGGGHSVLGDAVADGAVMVDLSSMKPVAVDPSARIARAGAGVTWAEFDQATGRHGLATTGGSLSSVGIAGGEPGGWVRSSDAPLRPHRRQPARG